MAGRSRAQGKGKIPDMQIISELLHKLSNEKGIAAGSPAKKDPSALISKSQLLQDLVNDYN